MRHHVVLADYGTGGLFLEGVLMTSASISSGEVVTALAEKGKEDTGSLVTRHRLLDAVIQLATSVGLDKVTYRSVAAEAGLSHGLVRFYFGSREAMITQALERAARLDVAESRITAESIDSFGSEFVATLCRKQSRQLLQYDYLLRAVRGGVPVKDVLALYAFYIDQVSETLNKVQIDDKDGSLAALIMAAVDGLVLQHAIHGSPHRTELILERLREVLRLLQRREIP
jgi:AcrR family transcriptional regulator